MKRSRKRSRLLIGSAITLVLLAGAGTLAYRHLYPDLDAAVASTIDIIDAQGKVVGHYRAPSAEEIAGLGNAESVMLGRRLLNETARRFIVGGPVGDFELLLCHGTVCVVGKMRDLILQLSKSSIYSTKS